MRKILPRHHHGWQGRPAGVAQTYYISPNAYRIEIQLALRQRSRTRTQTSDTMLRVVFHVKNMTQHALVEDMLCKSLTSAITDFLNQILLHTCHQRIIMICRLIVINLISQDTNGRITVDAAHLLRKKN